MLARAIDEQALGATVPRLTMHAIRGVGQASGPRVRGVTVAIDIGGGPTDHAFAVEPADDDPDGFGAGTDGASEPRGERGGRAAAIA